MQFLLNRLHIYNIFANKKHLNQSEGPENANFEIDMTFEEFYMEKGIKLEIDWEELTQVCRVFKSFGPVSHDFYE